MKVLMVCLGNICRSPLAEGILASKIAAHQLNWEVDSAGTGAWHVGELPDPRSIQVARKYGIDITNQRARKFVADDFENFDRIYAMDATNYQNILRLAKTDSDKEKVDLILNLVKPGYNMQVVDPYYGEEGFENVFNQLSEACDILIEQVN